MVPAAINTYLREYQRDGVRFFWNQYQQGRGGLLGDDMGLVSAIPCHFLGAAHKILQGKAKLHFVFFSPYPII